MTRVNVKTRNSGKGPGLIVLLLGWGQGTT